MSPDEIFKSVGNVIGLLAEHIVKKGRISRAQNLAVTPVSGAHINIGEPESAAAYNGAAITEIHQYYATFKVELLLDDSGDVRGTRSAQVQRGACESWGGWEETRLR